MTAYLLDEKTQPRARRRIAFTVHAQVIENGLEQIDWDDHIGAALLSVFGDLLHQQRADSKQFAVIANQGGAAPAWGGRRGEQGFNENLLPVARKFTLRHDDGLDRVIRSTLTGDNHLVGNLQRAGVAELHAR